METYAFLKKCPMFAGMDDSQLERLKNIAHVQNYSRGQTLFNEGQTAGGFYLLISGGIKLFKLSHDGKEQILHIVNPGESFAEAALFSGSVTYPAYAESTTKSHALYFPRSAFLQLLKDDPQLSLNMLASMSHYLRRFNKMIERLSVRDVATRLAQYLLQEVPPQSGSQPKIQLKMTKTQLAAHLGTISETLSRTFKKLKEHDIISVQGKQITILDLEALRDTASGN
ncbi:MAG: Crp/Fnr family transcriptional regulator [Candidatus Schekmanbacteria bacterium]|nr:Crp/Fnr family transcriptional regulator [Candidatus Schekmanbacteria bacterium]